MADRKSGKLDYLGIYRRLFPVYGECRCALHFATPFQLLAAVMLSAQCRDDRVNMVTAELFAAAPDAAGIAAMPLTKLEKIIRPCGLHGSKSRNLQAAAAMILQNFGGFVPSAMEQLLLLPGIGRKSANVVLGDAFGVPGFPVDTHVRRLLNRIGCVHSNDPVKIESEVTRQLPAEYWTNFSHMLIYHGRAVCHAGRPQCESCVLKDICRKKLPK